MAESSGGITARDLLLHAALLLVILAVFFPGVFLRAETLVPGDLLYDLAPWKYHFEAPLRSERTVKVFDALALINKFHWMAAEQIREGYWPLWDPLEHGGLPLLANMQSAVLYPPRLVHLLISDGPAATTLFILLKLFLCGMTAYIAAVWLGMPRFAARFVSVAWMLGGYNYLWCYWMEPDVAAWFPLLFLGAEFVLQERFRRGFMLTASAGTLTLLAGHPETAFSFTFFLGVYVLARLALAKQSVRLWFRVLSILALAWSVALLFSAAQLVPFVEYLANSAEGAARAHQSSSRLPLRNLTGFWLPFLWDRSSGKGIEFAWTNWLFFGVTSWVAVTALMVRFPKNAEDRRRVLALCVASAAALLTAVNTPPFHLLNTLPLFRAMWYRYNVAFPLFAICLLGGLGIVQWFSSPPTVHDKARLRTMVLAGLVGLLGLAWFVFAKAPGAPDEFVFYKQVVVTTVSVIAALILFKGAGPVSRNATIALLLLELFGAFRAYHPSIPRNHVYIETRLTHRLREFPMYPRFSFFTAGLLPGLMTYYGLEGLQGYDGLYPHRSYERFRIPGNLELWGKMEPFCAVRWYLCAKGAPHELWFKHGRPEDTRLVDTLDGFDVYENLRARPRAYLIPQYATVASDPLSIMNGLADPDYEPELVTLTDAPPGIPSPSPENGELGTATVAERTPDNVLVHVSAAQSCVLVLADNFYPGWRAEIDGDSAEIFPAYTVFRGVVIPAGEHHVRFYYAPGSFRVGFAISVISLTAGLVGASVLLARPKAHRCSSRVRPS